MPIETDIYYRHLDTEKDGKYSKMTTADLSAGGFRCYTETQFEEGALLNCMLIAGYEALPATAQILSSAPGAEKPLLYDTRAIFYKLNDEIRDRVVKYIFSKQRQTHSKFYRRKN